MAIGTSKLLVEDKIRKATDIISGQYQKQMKKEGLLSGIGSIGSALALMLMPGVKEAGALVPALKGILQKPIERNIMALLRKFGMGADLSALKTVDGWGGDAIKRIKESYSDFMAESEDWKGNLMKNVALQYASAFAGGELEKPFGKLKGSISDKLSEAISKVKGVKPLAPTAVPQFQVPETSITGKLGVSGPAPKMVQPYMPSAPSLMQKPTMGGQFMMPGATTIPRYDAQSSLLNQLLEEMAVSSTPQPQIPFPWEEPRY